MPAWTRTAVLQEPLTHHLTQRACLHQVQEKGMSQHGHRDQLEPIFPRPDAHTLEAELTFVHAPDLLDLPALQIGQSYLPDAFFGLDRSQGHQIPRPALTAHY